LFNIFPIKLDLILKSGIIYFKKANGVPQTTWLPPNLKMKLQKLVELFSPQLVLSVGFEAMASATATINGLFHFSRRPAKGK
jgi:hypothetical protein